MRNAITQKNSISQTQTNNQQPTCCNVFLSSPTSRRNRTFTSLNLINKRNEKSINIFINKYKKENFILHRRTTTNKNQNSEFTSIAEFIVW